MTCTFRQLENLLSFVQSWCLISRQMMFPSHTLFKKIVGALFDPRPARSMLLLNAARALGVRRFGRPKSTSPARGAQRCPEPLTLQLDPRSPGPAAASTLHRVEKTHCPGGHRPGAGRGRGLPATKPPVPGSIGRWHKARRCPPESCSRRGGFFFAAPTVLTDGLCDVARA